MKSVKSFFKLLCYVFITFLVIEFGGETVSAIDAPGSISVIRTNNNDVFYVNPNWPFYVKYANVGGHNYYAFCLDSSYNVTYNSINLDDNLYSWAKSNVNKVVSRAYELGLDDGDSSHVISLDGSQYTVSEKDLYGITQMAVWYTVHGNNFNGYTATYKKWVEADSARSAIFNELINAVGDKAFNKTYYVQLVPSGSIDTFTDTDNGTTISSVEYSVNSSNVPNDTEFVISRVNGNAKICVNGSCSDSGNATVKKGDSVVFKFDKPANGETVFSDFTISADFNSGYSAFFYNSGGGKTQNIGIVLPKSRIVDTSINIHTQYEDETIVKVQKVDINGNAVAGATLDIYKKDSNILVKSVESTDDNNGVSVTLPVGEYYLKEYYAPKGYVLSNEKAYFNVIKQGNEVKVENVDENGSSIADKAVITIADDFKKVRFRKVDENGNPISDIRIDIGDYTKALNKESDDLIACTVSRDDGYLVPCSGSDASDIYLSDEWYKLPVGTMLYFNEGLSENSNKLNGYYTKQYDKGMQVGFFGNNVVNINPNITVEESADHSSYTVTIHNRMYIDISKTDVTNKNEVAGAHLSIYDVENLDYFADSELGDEGTLSQLDKYVALDSWVSGNEPHRFIGIIPGHRYLLVEDLAPEGYIKLGSSVEFSMDSNGNVTVHSESEFSTTDKYKLGISNDYTKVVVSKTSFVTGEEVAGAELKICTEDSYNLASQTTGNGNDCQTKDEWKWTSGTEAHEIDRLPVGSYYIVETISPAGYFKTTNAVKFEVSNAEVLPVEFVNKPTKVVINKLDNVTKERIAGAQFKILKASDRSEVLDQDGKALEWISNADESWTIYALPAGEYILVETKVPEGYQEGMIVNGEVVNEYKFTVSDDVDDVDIEVYIEVLNAPNTGISTLNLFAIGALMIFTGYETIKIYKKKVNA